MGASGASDSGSNPDGSANPSSRSSGAALRLCPPGRSRPPHGGPTHRTPISYFPPAPTETPLLQEARGHTGDKGCPCFLNQEAHAQRMQDQDRTEGLRAGMHEGPEDTGGHIVPEPRKGHPDSFRMVGRTCRRTNTSATRRSATGNPDDGPRQALQVWQTPHDPHL